MSPRVVVVIGWALALLSACSSDEDLVGSLSQSLSQTTTIRRGVQGSVADAYIDASAIRRNHGSEPRLRVNAKNQALLSFDLSSIPTNAVINGASLTLFLNSADDDDDRDDREHAASPAVPIKMHRVTAAWDEAHVTYASFGQHFDPAVVGIIVPTSHRAYKTVDLKSLVQAWIAGTTPNNGVVLETAAREGTTIVSSEAAIVAQRPSLTVSYTVPDDHCAPNPCGHGGACTNTTCGFTCQCTAGFGGDTCNDVIDNCAGSPCQHGGTCTNQPGGYACTCAAGYSGTRCEIDIDDCAGSPCQNGGVCSDGVASFTCACAPGFTGARCETNIDDCAGNPCQHGGACTDAIAGYHCACIPGFEGTNCETNTDDCAHNACANGATCNDQIGTYTCTCAPGFAGALCETNIDDCAGAPCLNGATCIDGIVGYACACATGYTGTNCEIDIDDCAGAPCQNGGICVDGVGGFSCTCADGFAGPRCETNVDDCASNPCLYGGTCIDGVGSYTCVCTNGSTHAHCETDPAPCLSDASLAPAIEALAKAMDDANALRFVDDPALDTLIARDQDVSVELEQSCTPSRESDLAVRISALTIDVRAWLAAAAPGITSTPPPLVYIGDILSYSPKLSVDPAGFSYAIVQAPAGVVIEPGSGALTWQPDASDKGAHELVIEARRGAVVARQRFVVTVAEHAAVATLPVGPDAATITIGGTGTELDGAVVQVAASPGAVADTITVALVDPAPRSTTDLRVIGPALVVSTASGQIARAIDVSLPTPPLAAGEVAGLFGWWPETAAAASDLASSEWGAIASSGTSGRITSSGEMVAVGATNGTPYLAVLGNYVLWAPEGSTDAEVAEYGAALSNAEGYLVGRLGFRNPTGDGPVSVTVRTMSPALGKVPDRHQIILARGLHGDRLKTVVAHELFHVIQYYSVEKTNHGLLKYRGGARWWLEATAEYISDLVMNGAGALPRVSVPEELVRQTLTTYDEGHQYDSFLFFDYWTLRGFDLLGFWETVRASDLMADDGAEKVLDAYSRPFGAIPYMPFVHAFMAEHTTANFRFIGVAMALPDVQPVPLPPDTVMTKGQDLPHLSSRTYRVSVPPDTTGLEHVRITLRGSRAQAWIYRDGESEPFTKIRAADRSQDLGNHAGEVLWIDIGNMSLTTAGDTKFDLLIDVCSGDACKLDFLVTEIVSPNESRLWGLQRNDSTGAYEPVEVELPDDLPVADVPAEAADVFPGSFTVPGAPPTPVTVDATGSHPTMFGGGSVGLSADGTVLWLVYNGVLMPISLAWATNVVVTSDSYEIGAAGQTVTVYAGSFVMPGEENVDVTVGPDGPTPVGFFGTDGSIGLTADGTAVQYIQADHLVTTSLSSVGAINVVVGGPSYQISTSPVRRNVSLYPYDADDYEAGLVVYADSPAQAYCRLPDGTTDGEDQLDPEFYNAPVGTVAGVLFRPTWDRWRRGSYELFDPTATVGADQARAVYRSEDSGTAARAEANFPFANGYGWSGQTGSGIRLVRGFADPSALYLLDVHRFGLRYGAGLGAGSGQGLYYDKYKVTHTVVSSNAASSDAFELVESRAITAPYMWNFSGLFGGTLRVDYLIAVGERDQMSYTLTSPTITVPITRTDVYAPALFNNYAVGFVKDTYTLGNQQPQRVDVQLGAATYTLFDDVLPGGNPYPFQVYPRVIRVEDDEYYFFNTASIKPTLTSDDPTYHWTASYPYTYSFGREVYKNTLPVASATDSRSLIDEGVWQAEGPLDILVPYAGVRINGVDWFVGVCVTQTFDGTHQPVRTVHAAQFRADGSGLKKYDIITSPYAVESQNDLVMGNIVSGQDLYIGRTAGVAFLVYSVGTKAMAVPVGSDATPVQVVDAPHQGRAHMPAIN